MQSVYMYVMIIDGDCGVVTVANLNRLWNIYMYMLKKKIKNERENYYSILFEQEMKGKKKIYDIEYIRKYK